MTWTNPFFLHLRVPAETVAPRVPAGLTLETDGADAFVSLVAVEVRLARFVTFRQLALRTTVTGPHGPGLLFLDARVDSRLAIGARVLGFPVGHDRELAFSADAAGVALRAGGTDVKGLPEPGEPHALEDGLERRLVDRVWRYARLPVGGLVAARVEHAPWRVRRVEIDPDLRVPVAGARPIAARLAESLEVTVAELKIYRAQPFKQARAA